MSISHGAAGGSDRGEPFHRLIPMLSAILLLSVMLQPLPHQGQQGASAPQLIALTPAQLSGMPRVNSTGTELPIIQGAHSLGPLPPSTSLYFTVSFALRDSGALATLIEQQNTPGSPYFHHFLSLSQFESSFGPPRTLYDETASFFEAQGLTMVNTGSPMTLAFTGSASAVGKVFGTSFELYGTANGSVVYANSSPLSLPAPIGNAVSSVNGLTSIVKVRPMLISMPGLGASATAGIAASSLASVNSTMQRAVNFTSPGYLYTNASFPFGATQFLNPSTLTVAYNATPLYGAGDYGQGSTIAVVMAGGYNPSDLSAYALQVFNNSSQILGRLTPYPVNGGTANATAPGNSTLRTTDAFEFTLDIEYAATMAPGASIDAVFGPSLSIASLVSAYAKLTTLNPLPNVITNSWGGWEDTWWNLYGPSWQSGLALENYFMELTAMGCTIVAASGDSGGYDNNSGLLSPVFPASSPYVVAVGGVRTTAANSTGAAFPSPPQYTVNYTVAELGYSEVASQPLWVPNYPLNGTAVGGAGSETYWYYGVPGRADAASGGTGLSYWFSQPWWQHGPGIPDTGRRMIADIAAAADFNETVYFAGAWNFFWGGTSFAAPTIAGEIALLDTYMNNTAGNSSGRGSYYLGLAQPLIYRLGNDPLLNLTPFNQIISGNNSWDSLASSAGLGWPGAQNWPSNWTSASPGWNMLSGWGVPDAYNMVLDANSLLNSRSASDSFTVMLGNSTPTTVSGDGIYTFTLVNRTSAPVAGATVNISFTGADGNSSEIVVTTNSSGEFVFNAAGLNGYLAFYSSNLSGDTGFQPVWISRANLTGGILTARVLGSQSLMGGFDVFNGYLSPQAPAIEPLMPNTVAVQVTYQATPSSPSIPVYNSMVVAETAAQPYFSSPPAYTNPYYNNTLGNTTLRSLSYTNMAGIAYVSTWNVAATQDYTVNATYLGLNSTTSITVAPRYNIQSTNAFASGEAARYGTLPGYLGLGALNTIEAPAAEGGVSYSLPVRVTDWRGTPMPGVYVDIALMKLASAPYSPQPVGGTVTRTNSSGIAEITIDSALTLDAITGNGLLLVQAFNSSYSAAPLTALNSSILLPGVTNDSCAILRIVQPAFGEAQTIMNINGVPISTPYIGTQGTSASFFVSVPSVNAGDNITSIFYRIDGGGAVHIPLPQVGQQSFYWNFKLPLLAIGNHSLLVVFNDSLNFSYSVSYGFFVIGAGVNPPPTVQFISPSADTYATGNTPIRFSTEQQSYLISETLTVGQVTYNVLGLSQFTVNASAFGYGPLVLTLTATNLNGVSSTAFLRIFATPQPDPTAIITSPSDFTVISGANNITVGLASSGDYIVSETLQITGPNLDASYNTLGSTSVVLNGLGRGVYVLNYTVVSADGNQASYIAHFTILTSIPQTTGQPYYGSVLGPALIAIAVLSGIVIGMVIDRLVRRKRL